MFAVLFVHMHVCSYREGVGALISALFLTPWPDV